MFNKIYDELVLHFEKNKDKQWHEWLDFEKILVPGKQGIVGIFKLKNSDYKYIFKMSQCINFLVNHENNIMRSLNNISKYCPHFCKSVGIITTSTEPNRKSKNPFEIKSKYSIKKEVLLCEYIEKSHKFYNYIKTLTIDEEILYSIVKQVLMAINIAQKEKNFTHYDLHSNNVMVKKCNKNLVFLYKLDEENQFCIPTYGYYPIIIDYGFSYIKDMEDAPLWTSLAHTEVGFMSDRFDKIADPKLFLISVSDEIKRKRGTKKSKIFRRIVRNIFYPLKIEVDCGWDNTDKKSAVDYVLDIMNIHNNSSKIFKDYDYYCIDILQSLIILPLEEQNYKYIEKSFKTFLKEWVKIENEISNEFYNLYILKNIVNAARDIRPNYIKEDTQKVSIIEFKNRVYESINEVTKFCNPKNIDFEKFLCSLLLLAENIEGVLYDIINSRMKVKQKEYDMMPLKNIEEIYAAITVNLQDNYNYNKDTVFYVIDYQKKTNDIFKIPLNEINNINKVHNLAKGCYVYDLYKNSKK
jgi:hypothetical protein